MSTVNYVDPNLDRTVRIFDQFYQYETFVNQNEYDVVYSFFKSVFSETLAARNFTITLFRIADQTNIPVLELLAELQNKNQLELTATLSYYLNNLRSNSTLLGVSVPVVPNVNAARNVLP